MKLIDVLTMEGNKVTTATVSHLGKTFTGISKLNEKDGDTFSAFFGGELAVCRAELNAIKYELKIAREEFKVIQNFIKCAEGDKRFDKDSEAMKPIWKQYNIKERRVKQLAAVKNRYIERIKQMPIEREETLKKLDKIKQRKQQ